MNKLFTKIATLSIGLAMAIGVGVAVGVNKTAKSVFAEDTTDTITASDLPATGTTYTDFSGVSKTSDAVYAGNSAKASSGAIQMRSKNSNSGIVSTTSGGTVKSVTITVASGSNTIDVYGSNTAYSAASDLYDSSKQGTKVGSTSATGTINFTDEYAYVGIRSNSGAIYLTNVEITWSSGDDPGTSYSVTDNVEHGSLNKSSVKEGANLVTTITPDSGYDLPTTVSVTMGGVAATVSYEGGVVTLNNVTGDVVVTATCPVKHGYSPDDPFTVAEAIAEIDAKTTASGAYVSGIVCQVDAFKDTYKSIDYWISDDGETTTKLECYSGKGIDGADFAAKEDVEVGATVVVTGNLKVYKGTYEFDINNYQVSYVPPVHEDPTLTLSSYHTHLVNGGDSYVITASYESFSATPTLSVDGDPSYVGVTVSGNTITLSPTATGTETLTIRATYNSEIDTKDFKLVVTTNAGTAASPFTVEEAKAVIDVMENISANVVGVVSQVDSYSSDYHSITYWLSDDGTTTSQQLEVYSGKGYNGANFNEVGDMVTGTKVVVNGTLKIYNTTYEFDKNNKVVGFPNVDAFAQELLTRTDEVCAGYEEGDNNHDAIAAIWETLSGASYYGKLTSTEKAFIISVEGKEDGSTVEQAMARYDFLTARYNLDNFISRTLSTVLVKTQPISNSQVNTNAALVSVIIVAVVSVSAIGVLLVIKRRKSVR